MAQIFSTQFCKGSYIERWSGVAGVNTNGKFKRTEKGYAWLGNGASSRITLGQSLTLADGTDFTIELWYKTGVINNVIFGNDSFGDANYIQITDDDFRIANSSGNVLTSIVGTDISDGRWHHGMIINDASEANNITSYLDNDLRDSDALANTEFIFDLIGDGRGALREFDGLIAEIIVHDKVLSPDERARAFEEFESAKPFAIEKYPKYNPHTKPTDLSQLVDTGLIASYNMIPNNTVLVDISGNGGNGTIPGAGPRQSLDGLIFDGVDDSIPLFIPAALAVTVKTITFRIKLKTTTEQILEGGAGARFILANAGTLTYADYDNAFIDGVDSNVVVAGQWMNIVVVSSTAVDNSTATLGLNGANYGAFEIEDLKYWSTQWTLQDAKDYHDSFAKRVVLIDHFRDAAVGQSKAREWKQGTGTYVINELTAQDAVLKELDAGTKYLQCDVAGTIAIPSKQAYGEWEVAVYKEGGANTLRFYLIADKPEADVNESGYRVLLASTEAIYLQEINGGATTHFNTAASYIAIQTWYKLKITRTLDGAFTTYIKGGAFGANYVLVDVTGGSGTNPVTDNTYTTSEYFVLDFDAGDRIALINIREGVEQ